LKVDFRSIKTERFRLRRKSLKYSVTVSILYSIFPLVRVVKKKKKERERGE